MLGTVTRSLIFPVLAALAWLPGHAAAGVIIAGTRVVYPAGQSDVSVQLQNASERPALVQVWMDDGDQDVAPEQAKVPFLVTPPLLRMEAQGSNAVRIRFAGAPLRSDRESLYWLNVLEVPPSAGGDSETLQLAFRSRIKVFYRPQALMGDAAAAYRQLRWSLQQTAAGWALRADNPTPWHISFAAIGLQASDATTLDADDAGPAMVAPMAVQVFPLEGMTTRPSGRIEVVFSVIDDVGAVIPVRARLSD
jgi:chaperone protein EcpD